MLLPLLAVAALSAAIPFDAAHQTLYATNPPDLKLSLTTTNGQSRFHSGESIPITLAFSSSTPGKYKLNAATYDRSGRLRSEEFTVDRHDALDPLANYIGAGVLGFIGGGLSTEPTLDAQPVEIHLFLNDWLRFDQPGVYRVFVKSWRLQRERLPPEPGSGNVALAALSNILEFEILPPEAEWAAAKLAEISRVLAVSASPGNEEIALARQALADLGTADAVRFILARARNDPANLDQLALFRSPNRSVVIQELDAYLVDPGVGFGSWPVTFRAFLDFVERYPEPMVPLTAEALQRFDIETARPIVEKRQHEFQQMQRTLAAHLIPALARKDLAVRDQCIQTIATFAPGEAKAAGLIEPEDFGMSRALLIAGFNDFTPERQLKLLSEKWTLIRGPEMLPSLRLLIQKAPVDTISPILAGKLVWAGPTDLAGWALYRLRELAPAEEKQVLLNDLASANPKFIETEVRELPAEANAAVDEVLISKFKADKMTALSSVPVAAKFGTRRLLESMLALYKGPQGPCLIDQWFVAYFTRVDVQQGSRILAQAMAARTGRGCYTSLLSEVASVTWNPVVKQQALLTLNDPSPDAAADAVRVLAAYAGNEAQSVFLRRLEEWSRQWSEQPGLLTRNSITSADPYQNDRLLGDALFRALADSPAWVVDEPLARRLRLLCVDDLCRKQWDDYKVSPVLIEVQPGYLGLGIVLQIGAYSAVDAHGLTERMAQYPRDTVFQWCGQFLPGQFEAQDLQEVQHTVEQFAMQHSMRVEACPAKPNEQ